MDCLATRLRERAAGFFVGRQADREIGAEPPPSSASAARMELPDFERALREAVCNVPPYIRRPPTK